jgi:hypothetical protein
VSGVGGGSQVRRDTGSAGDTFGDAEGRTTPVPKHRKQLEFAPPQVHGFPLSVIDVLLVGIADFEDIPKRRSAAPDTLFAV